MKRKIMIFRRQISVIGLPVILFTLSLGAGRRDVKSPLQSAPQVVAIVGGTIIDGTGGSPIKGGIIIMKGNRIDAVGSQSLLKVPNGAQIIDASGKYIIPGLMDANTHLCLLHDWTPEILARYEGRFEDLIEEAAQVALKYGNTTMFDTWGPLQPLMNVRDRINRGETQGARMFVAGNIIGLTGPLGRDFNEEGLKTATKSFAKRINAIWEENVGPDLGYMTADQVRAEIRKYIARGVDFLKYASSGHVHESFLVFSEEVQKALVDEGHKAGLTVQAHTTSVESLRMAIEASVDIITHVAVTGKVAIPEATISDLVKKQIPGGISASNKRKDEIDKRQYADDPVLLGRINVMRQHRQRLIKAAVPLYLVTDGGLWDHDYMAQFKPEEWWFFESYPGEGLLLRCIDFVESGVSPMDTLLAATRNPASAYHKLDQIGTIEKGKLADLVILNADPLADINNIRNIFMVVKDGKVVDRDKLPLKKILYPQLYNR